MELANFTAENVEMAVHQFYRNTGQPAAVDVNRWLTSAQISTDAWNFSWHLLQPGKSIEVQFFGANSLHMKIARFWHEVPSDQVEVLKQQLLQLVQNFINGPKIVLTRICVTLSSFILQTLPEHWPNAVANLISMFLPSAQMSLQSQQDVVLLEILTVLPEEFLTSHHLPERRGLLKNELQKGFCFVSPLLIQCLSNPSSSPHIHEQALRCFSGWAQFGLHVQESENLISLVFGALRNEAYFEISIDALIFVFQTPDNHRFPRSMHNLLVQVIQLTGMFDEALQEHDMEVCQGLTKLFVISAENNIQQLLLFSIGTDEEKRIASSLVRLIVQCSAMPGYYPVDECCSDVPFGFWYNFQDELMVFEHYDQLRIYFDVYMELVRILLVKVKLPPDSEYQSWNADEKESNRCYRQDIADALVYFYTILNVKMMDYFCHYFQETVERSKVQPVSWQEFDAILYSLTSLAEGAVQIENHLYVSTMFNLLPSIPTDNVTLISQAMYFIAAFSEWLSDQPSMLLSTIPYILRGLNDAELAVAASVSLNDILQENKHHMRPMAEVILESIKMAVESGKLHTPEVNRLVICFGYVLSTLPYDHILNYVNILFHPHIDQLRKLAMAADLSAFAKSVIQEKIKMLASLFYSLNTNPEKDDESDDGRPQVPAQPRNQQPALFLLQQILPVISQVLHNHILDTGIVSDVCTMLKRAISNLLSDFSPLIDDVSSLIIQSYEVNPQPALLDIAKQLLVLFVDDVEYQSTIITLYTSVCNRTLKAVESGSQSQTDLVEALMHFLAQITKKNVNLLKDPSCNLAGLFQAGIIGICMHESPTSKAACFFVSSFLGLAHEIPAVQEIVSLHGRRLIEVLVRALFDVWCDQIQPEFLTEYGSHQYVDLTGYLAIGGEAPRANINPMADVLLALNRFFFDLLCSCLNDVINLDGFPNPGVTREQKEQFAQKIITERKNKRKLKETVNEYTLLWRGLINTEYAAQTSHVGGMRVSTNPVIN